MQPIINYIKYPSRFFLGIIKKTGFLYSDRVYLKLYYFFEMGKSLNIRNPKTFNEKLQWLKIYNRRPEYTKMVDKYAVKDYVASIIGTEYIIPTLGVWDKPEDIEWDKLPNQFVLKTTHGGGGMGIVICRDKSCFNFQEAINKLNGSLKFDIYRLFREWPYKNVQKRILAETYITDSSGELKDYKFFCFSGEVKIFKVDFNRFEKHQANYYDRKFNLLPFGEVSCPPDPEKKINLPYSINEMIRLAERLAVGNPFMRVDFYDSNGKVYFGEITFFPAGGMGKFEPENWDKVLGDMINLESFRNSTVKH